MTFASVSHFAGVILFSPKGGHPAIAFDKYRSFIQFILGNQWYECFADLIMCGELLVGGALILGAFTGVAIFAGSFINRNFKLLSRPKRTYANPARQQMTGWIR